MVASINKQAKPDSSDPTSLTKRLPADERQVRLDLQEKRLEGLVDRTLVTRCRELYGNADLFHHLADNGIKTWDMLNSSFHHVITSRDFVDATEDVFLTETHHCPAAIRSSTYCRRRSQNGRYVGVPRLL